MGMGVSIKVTEEPKPPVGPVDWLKANWPWVASGVLGVGLVVALTRRRK